MADQPATPAIAPYSQEWINAKVAQMWPQIEAQNNRSFGAFRGARFGAQGATASQLYANLYTQIATEAATAAAKVEETKRQEGVAEAQKVSASQRDVAEKMREEGVATNTAARNRSWYEMDQARNKENEDARMTNLYGSPEVRAAKAKLAEEEKLGKVSRESLQAAYPGASEDWLDSMVGGKPKTANGFLNYSEVNPSSLREGSLYTTPESYDRVTTPAYSPSGGGGGFLNYAQSTASSSPTDSFVRPTWAADYTDQTRAPGHGTSADAGAPSGTNYTDPYDRNRWSGNVNANSANELWKPYNTVKDAWKGIWG